MTGKRLNVLALDLASTIGWACGKPGTTPIFGSHRIAKPHAPRAATYASYKLWLGLIVSARKPKLIVFEAPLASFMGGHTNVNAARLLIGLAEILELWCYENKIELREASVSAVRHHFINANPKSAIAKGMVVQRCRELGWNVANDDEGDAVATWHYMCSILDPNVGTTSTPLFEKLKDGTG